MVGMGVAHTIGSCAAHDKGAYMGFEYKEQLKDLLPEYMEVLEEEGLTANRGNGYYDCPICGSGTKEKGTPAFHIRGQKFQCFSCDSRGDIFDLVAYIDGLEGQNWITHYNRTLRIMRPYLDLEKDVNMDTKNIAVEYEEEKDYKPYLQMCHKNISKTSYFINRGLSKEIIDKFMLGYDPKNQVVTIPVTSECKSYVQRSVCGDKKYYKHGNGIFNIDALYSEGKKYIFVAEGQIDAMSFEEVGHDAIGLGGVNGISKLVDRLKEHPCKKTLILVLDNDKAGHRATGKLLEELAEAELNCRYMTDSRFYSKYKDANEFLVSDREEFEKRCKIMAGRIQKQN